MTAVLIAIHVLAAVIWVGGLFFAYICLRPAVASLSGEARASLWRNVLGRFFATVWVAVIALLVSGYALVAVTFGTLANAPLYVHLMQGLGIIMMALFAHVYFAPFRKLKQAVDGANWADAASQVARIRKIVPINLTLGLIVIALASGGRWL